MDRLIIGLGNPGKQYAKTRHNIGFMAIDALADNFGSESFQKKFDAEFSKIEIAGQKIILAKPLSYMNNSGIPTMQLARFFKLPSEKVIVIHDDLDLALGRMKFKIAGSDGGHNGIKSLDQYLSKHYHRLRFGIARPEHSAQVKNYVLSDFTAIEQETADKAVAFIIQNIQWLLHLQYDKFNGEAGQFFQEQLAEKESE